MKRAPSTEELVKAKLSRFQTQKKPRIGVNRLPVFSDRVPTVRKKVKEKQLSFEVRENSGYFPSHQRNSKFFDFVQSQGTLFSVNQIYVSRYGKAYSCRNCLLVIWFL